MLYTTPETQANVLLHIDKYSDNFTEDASMESLHEVFEQIDKITQLIATSPNSNETPSRAAPCITIGTASIDSEETYPESKPVSDYTFSQADILGIHLLM